MKYTSDEREQIRTWVMDLHLAGIRKTKDICAALAEKGKPISVRQAHRYRDEIRKECIAFSKYDRDEQLGLSIGRLELIFRKAMAGGKLSQALMAQRELDELCGLKTQKIELVGKVPFVQFLTSVAPPSTNGKKKHPLKIPARPGASGSDS